MVTEAAEEYGNTGNSSTKNEKVSQTDHNEHPPSDPDEKIYIGQKNLIETVNGPDMSPQQRRKTEAKLKDLEHAQSKEKEKVEQTAEAIRMQKINEQIERTSSVKRTSTKMEQDKSNTDLKATEIELPKF